MPITTLFFDLDGTLYPGDNGIWDAIASRMELFMQDQLHLPKEKIPTMRQEFYQKFGTTLRGLQEYYTFDQMAYLRFVHNIPLEKFLKTDQKLRNVLMSITTPKWIFTNSDRQHSERVLNLLNINDQFEDIIDVTAMNFINKPNPLAFQRAIEIAGHPNPKNCIFFEDSAKNLIPAKNLGMKTILVGQHPASNEADLNIPNIYFAKEAIEKIIWMDQNV